MWQTLLRTPKNRNDQKATATTEQKEQEELEEEELNEEIHKNPENTWSKIKLLV